MKGYEATRRNMALMYMRSERSDLHLQHSQVHEAMAPRMKPRLILSSTTRRRCAACSWCQYTVIPHHVWEKRGRPIRHSSDYVSPGYSIAWLCQCGVPSRGSEGAAIGFLESRLTWRRLLGRADRRDVEIPRAQGEVEALWDKLAKREKELNMSKVGARDLSHAVKAMKTALEKARQESKVLKAKIATLEVGAASSVVGRLANRVCFSVVAGA